MALTKASLVDLNAGELILDLDADTSITADTDDTIHFKIGGTDRVTITGTALSPSSSDGSALGTTALEWSDLFLADGAVINFGDDQDVSLTHVADTGLLLSSTDQLQFGDSGTYIHQSADGVLDLVSDTEIEINATTIDMNGVLNLSGNLVVGSATVTEAQFEILDGATVTTDELNILDGVTATTAELNLLDGDTSPGTTAINDSDALIINDATTMRLTTVQTLAAYLDDEITAMPNLVTSGALNSGSITSGFGNIDNGASNITSGGLVKLDVDADADDITGDSATGRLTLGAGEDLNLYHGGTHSYIVNDTGNLVVNTGASDADIVFSGNDGGSAITALTLDMSAAGAATFNSTVTATGFVIGSADISEAELEVLDGLNTTTAELNIMDGGTSATSTTVADADRVVMNDNGTMVQVAVTDLAAYFDDEITAMPNLTSVGTLTALTVDDVAVDGKVITMTGSSSDTAVFTAGTNGTLSIVTTDAAAAAANIQITADGTAELAGTTVTLDSSGGITLDADGGTITFADAGSSLGTITSSGYSGTAAVATAVTVTDNESTNENNVLTFVAGADADGGNVGLESDGNLTYNPSTGTLSVTNLVTSGTHTVTNSVEMTASSTVVFEGATADAHETTLGTVDPTGDRTINLPNQSGTLPVLSAASATAITATPEEINLIDGGTARGTTAVASGDGILINDGGTMRMTNVDTVSTYFASHSVGGGNIVTTGALNSGTITSGFGNINTGSSTIDCGTVTAAALAVDNITIDGTEIDLSSGDLTVDVAGDIILDADGGEILFHDATTAMGHVSMASSNITIKSLVSDKDIIFQGNDGGAAITALTLDMSAAGSATFNHDLFLSTADSKIGIGTTSPGRSLEISAAIPIIKMVDTDSSAGYMEMGNAGSEFKFDLDKDDALASSILTFKVDGSYVMKFRDGASEFADGSAASPSITNIGDINTGLFFSAADTMAFSAGGTSQFTMADGAISPVTDSDVDLGTSSLYYKNAYIDAILTTGNITSPSNIIISVDTDADDVSGDSATGRLTLGAGEDLNLYHGGTHSYIVNDTGNLVIDTAGDLTFDAAGNDFKFLANGTEILNITNSSSDVIIKPLVDAKDIIFQQRDGTEVARIEDNATFNVSSAGKFAYAGTAVTSTAAELNILDGVTSTAAEINIIDGNTSATSTTLVDADRVVVNDNGTMVQVAMTDVKTYIGGGTSWQAIKTGNFTAEAGQGVFANTTSSAFTVTLPASPDLGDEVTIVDYAGTFDSNACTIGRNSQPIQGVAEDLVVSTERASFTLVYVDSTQGWLFKND